VSQDFTLANFDILLKRDILND